MTRGSTMSTDACFVNLYTTHASTLKHGINFSVRRSAFLELFKKKEKYITQVRMFQESMENGIIIRSHATCDKDQMMIFILLK